MEGVENVCFLADFKKNKLAAQYSVGANAWVRR
jgi:peroxiredoxin